MTAQILHFPIKITCDRCIMRDVVDQRCELHHINNLTKDHKACSDYVVPESSICEDEEWIPQLSGTDCTVTQLNLFKREQS